MRSRKRPSKIRVLILPEQGIASAMVHELAMLFCHAGADVFFALSEAAGSWFSPQLALETTGNQAFSETSRPAWLKSKHRYDLAVVFAGTSILPEEFAAQLFKADHIDLLLPAGSATPTAVSQTERPHILPARPEKLPEFYQQLFAAQIRLLSGKRQLAGRSFSGLQLEKGEPASDQAALLKKLHRSLLDRGFFSGRQGQLVFSAPEQVAANAAGINAVLHSEAQSYENAVSTSDNLLHLRLEAERIHLKTRNNSRILPTIGNQCCYTRLADFFFFQLCNNGQQG